MRIVLKKNNWMHWLHSFLIQLFRYQSSHRSLHIISSYFNILILVHSLFWMPSFSLIFKKITLHNMIIILHSVRKYSLQDYKNKNIFYSTCISIINYQAEIYKFNNQLLRFFSEVQCIFSEIINSIISYR